jgi:hypothetical protein
MHIDDHTLELYVLGAKSVDDKRSEIEAHLQACEHCRAYAQKVDVFYSQLDENMEKEFLPSPKPALVRRHADELAPIFYRDATPVPYRPATRIEKFRHFTRRHPIAVGSGTLAVLAGLAMMVNVVRKPAESTETNPAHYFYNDKNGLIEIRNASHKTLWQLSTQENLAGVRKIEHGFKTAKTVLADLDGDGTNEVLTILPIGNEQSWTELKVYMANRMTLWSKSFPEEFKYSTRTYSPNFGIANFIVEDLVEKGKKEIWLTANNVGRSPSATVRLDAHGNILGKYWHFGNLNGIYALDVNNDGKKEILLTGINDLNEESYHQQPAIVVLYPSNVVESGKSTTAPEFGFPFSTAEMYCIRLPLSDLHEFYKINASVSGIADINDKEILFEVVSRAAELAEAFSFQYYFNRDMSIREVKSNNTTDRIHSQLVSQGKLTGKIDSAYLSNLKNGVRYWDGREWQKQLVRVNNSQFAVHH